MPGVRHAGCLGRRARAARVYCGDPCRWRAGHLAALQRARETRRARAAELAGLPPVEQLAALAAELAARSWTG